MESSEGLVKSVGWSGRIAAAAQWLGQGVLDVAYPPVCLNCDAPTAHANGLCAACFVQLRPITKPHCPVLGLPFDASLGDGALSAEAIADPPPFGRARSAVVYNDVAQTIVSRMKYGDRPEFAAYCAKLLVVAGEELWPGNPVLLPVPLHPSRLRERRYNQSAELAHQLARLTGLDVDPQLVRRARKTRQQVGLSGDGRQRNVSGAFAAHPDILGRLKGRRVVVIDDVYTTGATSKAVTRSLLRAGAEAVDVVSFARVVIGADLPI